jgi:hypothetical protein
MLKERHLCEHIMRLSQYSNVGSTKPELIALAKSCIFQHLIRQK